MNNCLNNSLLVSDIDGTLISSDGSIPQKNLEAIDKLKESGGYFGFASGRPVNTVRKYAKQIDVNAPCLLVNGAIIYDFQEDRIVWSRALPKECIRYANLIKNKFTHLGIEAIAADRIYVSRMNEHVENHLDYEHFSYEEIPLEEIDEDIYKILFIMPSEDMCEVSEYAESLSCSGVRFVSTCEYFLEMIPNDVSKGESLRKLTDIMNINEHKVYAIGDYYNDIEMLSYAEIGAAVSNAPDDIKKVADIVVCSNNEGAIADFIKHIVES